MARPKICPGHGWPVSEEQAYQLPEYMTGNELARHLGVSRQAVCQWITREGLPAYRRANGAYAIIREEFVAWAQETGRFNRRCQPLSEEP